MKVMINDILCDTREDWGYPSDEEYVGSLYRQREAMRQVLEGYMDIIPHNGMGKENIEIIKYTLNQRNFLDEKYRAR